MRNELSYSLPSYTKPSSKTVSVLSFDPGSTNMGIACSEYHFNVGKVKILASAVMSNPVKGLVKDLQNRRDAFLAEVQMWVDLFQPKGLVIERYMNRGIRGNTGEEVGIMIGCLLTEFKEIKPLLLSAATWKNSFHRKFPEERDSLKRLYRVCGAQPHQLDAVLQGHYGIEKGLHTKLDYSIEGLLAGVDRTSLTKLTKRKLTYAER